MFSGLKHLVEIASRITCDILDRIYLITVFKNQIYRDIHIFQRIRISLFTTSSSKRSSSSSLFLQNFPCRCRHHCSNLRSVLALKVIRHLFKSDPFNAFMFVDMINNPTEISISFQRIRTKCDGEGTYLWCINRTCGRPETSGWMVMGKMNSS